MMQPFEKAIVMELPVETNELRTMRFQVGTDEYIALSFPSEDLTPLPLSASEQCVFRALLAGQSNREIATSRGRSLRTVANQVAAIFVKLRVGSRAELFAKYNGRPGHSSAE